MKITFCLYIINIQAEASEWCEKDVPGTLKSVFAGGAEPIHCPSRTTCRSDNVSIATRRYRSRFRNVILDRVHDSSIEGNQKDNIGLWIDVICLQVLALRAR